MSIESQYYNHRRQRLFMLLALNLYLLLVLLGFFAVLIFNAKHLNNYFKEKLTLTVYFKDGTPRSSIKLLEKQLKNDTLVKSVVFVSKEKSAEKAKKILGEDFIAVLGENPLQDNVELHLYGKYVNDSLVRRFKERLLQNRIVDDVAYEKAIMNLLNRNMKKIGTFILVFGLILLFIIYFSIRNTVRLSIYNKRFTIKTMQLVGATEGFIMRPFLWKYAVTGIITGIAAAASIHAIFYYIDHYIRADLFRNGKLYWIVLISLVLFSPLIVLITTYFSGRKILRMHTDDIHTFQ